MQIWESFLLAFSALLPLVNPLGSALVFLGLVGSAPPESYRKLARKIAINNIIFLGIIELLGSAILKFFGISLPIVQLAGGVVIAAIGWSVLNDPDEVAEEKCDDAVECVRKEHAERAERVLEAKAFYPFTFPVTSGPGTLVAMLTLTAHNSGQGIKLEVLDHVGLFLAVVVLSALVYVCYANAPRITKAIPPSTAHGILRVMAFILLCIGVQIAWNGMSFLLHGVIRG